MIDDRLFEITSILMNYDKFRLLRLQSLSRFLRFKNLCLISERMTDKEGDRETITFLEAPLLKAAGPKNSEKFDIHQDLAIAGKRTVRPPAVARFGGSEAILLKSYM